MHLCENYRNVPMPVNNYLADSPLYSQVAITILGWFPEKHVPFTKFLGYMYSVILFGNRHGGLYLFEKYWVTRLLIQTQNHDTLKQRTTNYMWFGKMPIYMKRGGDNYKQSNL